MRLSYILVALLAISTLIAACGRQVARDSVAEESRRATNARIITETATRVAVSKVGAKVCRRVTVGISEHDWIRGIVVELGEDKVHIRVEEPGRFPQALGGAELARGVLFWDTPLNWTPCI